MTARNQRLTITLPEETVRLLDRTIPKRERSRTLNEAVRQYLKNAARKKLQEELEIEYRMNAGRDLAIAEEWFPLEEEVAADY